MNVAVTSDGTIVIDFKPLLDTAVDWVAEQWRLFWADLTSLFSKHVTVSVRKVCDLDLGIWYYEVPGEHPVGDGGFCFTYYWIEGGVEYQTSQSEYERHAKGLPGYFRRGDTMIPVTMVRHVEGASA